VGDYGVVEIVDCIADFVVAGMAGMIAVVDIDLDVVE
jgi:hypothetical protein